MSNMIDITGGGVIAWIAAEGERPLEESGQESPGRKQAVKTRAGEQPRIAELAAHQFPTPHPLPAKTARSGAPQSGGDVTPYPSDIAKDGATVGSDENSNATKSALDGTSVEQNADAAQAELVLEKFWEESREDERHRRVYRGRTVGMLRRYMKYSIETGRLPSLLGREFFRAKVTSYQVVTFEERVIFVHDMEMCLDRLDEFSRQLIARHILQEHDQAATARLLQCTERTVRRLTPVVLDQLAEILLARGLLERVDSTDKKSCQGGLESKISVSDCEDSENKF
jgi:DNA-directed RNA polymerase specialized sigma24 family protein